MPPFFLEIDVDADGKVTVRGKRNHRWNANGGTQVMWKVVDASNFQNWTVDFPNGTPFENNQTHFGKPGEPGGRLKSHDGDPEEYSYDVTCTDTDGNQHNSDPEIVLWPD